MAHHTNERAPALANKHQKQGVNKIYKANCCLYSRVMNTESETKKTERHTQRKGDA